MLNLLKSMIALYCRRYDTTIFFCVERSKYCYPKETTDSEFFYKECSVTKYTKYDKNVLETFEDGYFFDRAFQIPELSDYVSDENSPRKIHLELIKYYVINMFNNRNNQEQMRYVTWAYVPAYTDKFYEKIIGVEDGDFVTNKLYMEDKHIKNVLVVPANTEAETDYEIVDRE